ncbi:endophilin-A3a isoform X2 [Scophthalmus maximus]|uniref:Endophilin-A3-like n=1 Tax=Scophthalmus maximus TaxID=52904 RepID=A0A8D3EEV3_SCOMX|nr:endophilin-A3a isoform X2 [Scophthalmus maximus]
MSVAGLKKQFHKASQLLSEKISGAEGTKLDEDFLEMERKIEVTNKSVFDLLSKTTEYLQPNPASRAKLNMLNTVSKIRGQVKTTGYPQTEGLLGDCMLRYGHELPEDSVFGGALVDMGEAMRQMADVKDSLDINVKQNFIDSLQNLQDKDLKEITHHLKKLEGRRLDFDYKKKRQGKIQEEEIQQAVEKFEESKELADRSMFNFLENDLYAALQHRVKSSLRRCPVQTSLYFYRLQQVEQVSQLSALIVAALVYHRQSFEILEELSGKLQKRISTANSRPKREFRPKVIRSSIETLDNSQHNGLSYSSSLKSTADHITTVPLSWPESPTTNSNLHQLEVLDQPCCQARYDFEPENEGELGFKEGDIIILTNQIDENWYEGMISGDSGFFPINYVEVMVPLPQ